MPVLERMAAFGMPLLIHGEVTDPEVDIFDREAVFIERVLDPLRRRLPELRIVLEHVTTAEAVAYVAAGGPDIAATITAHHLVINRNAIFAGGIRPHLYCLPIAKREKHRRALRRAATSGNPAFFLGTDSAPHAIPTKETACGCAGIFTAPAALEIYAEVFEEEGALDRLRGFCVAERAGVLPAASQRDPDHIAARGVDRAGADRRGRACRHAVPRPARRCAGACGPTRHSRTVRGYIGRKEFAMSAAMSGARERAAAFCSRYGLRVPILMAPMAGACPVGLAAAVANAGGMGGLGALMTAPDAIAGWANGFRGQSNGAFQINLWVPDPPPLRDPEHEERVRDFLGELGAAGARRRPATRARSISTRNARR